ncbi:MAG: hypothetical protein ABIJ46_03620 [bacterium]
MANEDVQEGLTMLDAFGETNLTGWTVIEIGPDNHRSIGKILYGETGGGGLLGFSWHDLMTGLDRTVILDKTAWQAKTSLNRTVIILTRTDVASPTIAQQPFDRPRGSEYLFLRP